MKQQTTDRHARSVLKAVSYRLCSITADAVILYGLTHSIAFSAGVVALMNTSGTVLYYLHERAWAHIPWGSAVRDDVPAAHT
jgi:uncharacterized membrane protein